jgi:hypothetical protein
MYRWTCAPPLTDPENSKREIVFAAGNVFILLVRSLAVVLGAVGHVFTLPLQ